MRLNQTRNGLWHESCKCVCKLNSSVCNNKQIGTMILVDAIVMKILLV